MATIVNNVNELRSINTEIKRLVKETTALRKRAKVIEQNIVNFLDQKDQPGVKFQDTAIVLETKQKYSYKGKKDKEEDSLRILEDHGIPNSKEVLDLLKRAGKGTEIESKKIKITKLKGT